VRMFDVLYIGAVVWCECRVVFCVLMGYLILGGCLLCLCCAVVRRY